MGISGRVVRASLLALVLGFGAVPATAVAASPADWMYEPTTFTEIRLEIPPASYQKLEEDPKGEYQPATFSIAETDGMPGTVGPFSEPLDVGVRLKGNLGSLRSINEKAAFKIKFDKEHPFLGLRKMTLNNMAQDPSMVHEAVVYDAFHAMDVPAPHVGFAYVTVNGKSYGLHLNIETQDKISMEKAFGAPFLSPPQHVYEGEYGADVSSEPHSDYPPGPGDPQERWKLFQVDEGKEGTLTDLEALLAAVEGSGGSFAQRVAGLADLKEMTRMWMVEKFAGHWDGYAGQSADSFRPNNYYLYSDSAGEFSMMPSGTDQTWEEKLDFGAFGGHLFELCLEDESESGCRSLYEAAGRQLLSTLTATSLQKDARCTAAAVNPWREYEDEVSEAEKKPQYSLSQTAQAQQEMREFIADRPAELAGPLGVALPPDAPVDPACPPLRPIGGFPSGDEEERGEEQQGGGGDSGGPTGAAPAGSSQGPGSSPAPSAGFRLLRVSRAGRALVVRFGLPSAGVVAVTGTVGSRRLRVCAGRGRSTGGVAKVRCPLSRAFLADRAGWRRRIVLRATFTQPPATQPSDRARASFRLRRRG